ncbi:alpha/beta-hydrolase [Lindgomyces ingoldianus]|uniref:Alpha/beta-hydrolase n=1 Tax=Lindgomyces ingoldianus TaxID=673940 RepID=A0ACB6QFU0_9PLEO|nr:alpha/beta-hydrolase [Lindgomyces ingoldianus]KAF2465428.1 alpha/beta-hydrolase [Lindgomyces ingoldianus]
MFQLSPFIIVFAALFPSSIAQSPPPTYDTVLRSPINPNITISYKTPDPATCVTAFSKQKQYTGYVNLPPFTLEPYQQNYSINTFFWFFEAREQPDTAPLTIWLNGGPGSSSMIGLFRELGPCEVMQMSNGSYGTQANMWGWDRSSNILFIDQPTQTGFSYDDAVNGTLNAYWSELTNASQPGPAPSWLSFNGTFSSGLSSHTQNTSIIAASASWHFLQGFLSAFPQYNPGTRPNSTTAETTGVNLFAESYGGQYGPAFANLFEAQNAKRIRGDIPRNTTLEIKLTSVGIINGIVDLLIQTPFWPRFAYNNTYGIRAIDLITQQNLISSINSPAGCKDLVDQCRASMQSDDPAGEGDVDGTNRLCENASYSCNGILGQILTASKRSPYDIRALEPYSFPSYAYLEYLNSADVLRSIGAGVNYTENSNAVSSAFYETGDTVRGTQIGSLASLLTMGVHVAFIYGDADLICNWLGGEAVSLEVAKTLPTYSTAFPNAGYADIIVNNTYVGGQVRQYDNLSFSRIYDAGHTVPSYQGETAFTVFTRIIQSKDIGTGNSISSNFSTNGPSVANHGNKAFSQQPQNTCWIRAINDTCNRDQISQILQSSGVVKYGVWYAKDSDYTTPSTATSSFQAGSTTTSSIPLTGVYTATGTPKPTSGASSLHFSTSRMSIRGLTQPWFSFFGPPDRGTDIADHMPYKIKHAGHDHNLRWIIPAAAVGGGFLL